MCAVFYLIVNVNAMLKSYNLSASISELNIVLSPVMWPSGVCTKMETTKH